MTQRAIGCRRLTLGKGEKLRHKSLVDTLFQKGKTIYAYPLRLSWRLTDRRALEKNFKDHVPDLIDCQQFLITVPKKKLKKATDRVLMRRRIREAYRLNRLNLKNMLLQRDSHGTLSMAFIYQHNAVLPYADIEQKMIVLLEKVQRKIEKSMTAGANPPAFDEEKK